MPPCVVASALWARVCTFVPFKFVRVCTHHLELRITTGKCNYKVGVTLTGAIHCNGNHLFKKPATTPLVALAVHRTLLSPQHQR